MEPVNLVRVFIASPGDVQPEREAVREACAQVNLELGDYLKVRLEAVGWETHVVPAVGAPPQSHIFKQIPFERLDLFVGILSNRFGTPTQNAGSGTEAEFLRALELRETTKRPHIMLYFGDEHGAGTDQAEREKVVKFRDSLNRAIYHSYKQVGSRTAEQVFADMFRTHLSLWLTRIAPRPHVLLMCLRSSSSFT